MGALSREPVSPSFRRVYFMWYSEMTSRDNEVVPELPEMGKTRVIAFEGNIGVGKSTLSRKLQEFMLKRCDVYKEQSNEAFLSLFYSDPVLKFIFLLLSFTRVTNFY